MRWLLRVVESSTYGFFIGSLIYGEVWFITWALDVPRPPFWAWILSSATCRAIYVRSKAATEEPQP